MKESTCFFFFSFPFAFDVLNFDFSVNVLHHLCCVRLYDLVIQCAFEKKKKQKKNNNNKTHTSQQRQNT